MNINLTVDGASLEVEAGGRLIDVLNRRGVEIPQVCYHPQLGSIQTCDTCMVEVDGKLVDVGLAWRNYFVWLRDELQLPELDPSAPSEHARQAMFNAMFKTPIRFLYSNWRLIFDPKAYRVVLHRLFRKSH